MELSSTFVCIMGMATVFAGLICLIVICFLLSLIARNTAKENPKKTETAAPSLAVSPEKAVCSAPAQAIENREELVAAISAAIAEELGQDVKNIRILSLRKI